MKTHYYDAAGNRVFERGVGETSSCGTAAASIVAALGAAAPNGSVCQHRVQFASGEELTVLRDSANETYEVIRDVELLDALTA